MVALEDRCCHRHAPLSRGGKEGDCVRGGYHGLKFDPSGCAHPNHDPPVPHDHRVAPHASLRRQDVQAGYLDTASAHSTHYFFQASHRADVGDSGTTQALHDGLLAALEEDRRMITARARNIERHPGADMLPWPWMPRWCSSNGRWRGSWTLNEIAEAQRHT